MSFTVAPEMSQQSEQSPVSYNEGPEVVENSVYPPVLSYRAALVGKAAKSVSLCYNSVSAKAVKRYNATKI